MFALRDAVLAWELDPMPTVGVCVAALLYGVAWHAVTRRGSRWPRRYVIAFGTGLLILLVAINGPPDVLSDRSFSSHMTQHVLIQMAAAPLLLLGAPVTLLLRADTWWLPRRKLVPILRSRLVRAISQPLVTFTLFACFIIASHLTPLYNLALERPWVHQLEHSGYLLTALLFWWPLIGTDPAPRRSPYPIRILYLFLIMPVMALLGVAIASSQRVIYSYYLANPPPWGGSPLADQRLAGTIMWESGMLAITPALALALFAWLNQDAREQARRDALRARSVGSGAPVEQTRPTPGDRSGWSPSSLPHPPPADP